MKKEEDIEREIIEIDYQVGHFKRKRRFTKKTVTFELPDPNLDSS